MLVNSALNVPLMVGMLNKNSVGNIFLFGYLLRGLNDAFI